MYEIRRELYFAAAHHLHGYEGPCANVHGHNWLVRATIRTKSLDEIGLGIDFREIKNALKVILDKMDHTDLNLLFDPMKINPTAENIARYIFDEMTKLVTKEGCWVYTIEILETPGTSVTYYGEDPK